jgi:GDP-mannose 6-dehydrogenase
MQPHRRTGTRRSARPLCAEGRLRATTDTADAVDSSEVSLLCVGTRAGRTAVSTSSLERQREVGRALRNKRDYHVVVVRSTVLPGTTHEIVIPALERASGKTHGDGFGVSVNPEFLREGTALKDFRKPPLTVVGHNHAADASGTIALYQAIDAPLVSTSIRVAEMMKYTSNTWHALKVVFANEIGNLCKKLNVDSHEVMDIFCRDEKLNLSPYYLKPGLRLAGRACRRTCARCSIAPRRSTSTCRSSPRSFRATRRRSAGARSGARDRQEERRPARIQFQGGHR